MNIDNALILIDLQLDFCEGGALGVNEGARVIPVANKLQPYFDEVIATKDWHPANHASFAENHTGLMPGDVIQIGGLSQVLWPAHCVQHTDGAALHPALKTERINKIIYKGTNAELDSYSAFYDNAHKQSTGLTNYLKSKNITTLYMMGLATDYCVKFSALDALTEGFTVYLIQDGCRGVELSPGDIDAALIEMQDAGVRLIQSHDIVLAS